MGRDHAKRVTGSGEEDKPGTSPRWKGKLVKRRGWLVFYKHFIFKI
jgi:hypothetical protein